MLRLAKDKSFGGASSIKAAGSDRDCVEAATTSDHVYMYRTTMVTMAPQGGPEWFL